MFKNKKILVLGMARSGYSVAKLLINRDNEVTLIDKKEEQYHNQKNIIELRNLGVNLIFGDEPDILDNSFDYLVKNPGVFPNHKYVLLAKKLGVEVINEVEVTYRLLPEGVKVVGITGTNGKTTTTTITYEILNKFFGKKVILAGNIGIPLSSMLNSIKSDDILLMEISCQQLNSFTLFKPDIAAVTNLSPTHLDYFGDYDSYLDAKKSIFSNQGENDIAILNIDNVDVLNISKNIKSVCKYFSSEETINGCYIDNDVIYYYDEEIINVNNILLKGIHNYENIMTAIMICKELGVSNEDICSVLTIFKGVEHRLEYVKEKNGVRYYNDSKATNIECCGIAIKSFVEPTILILGGMERGQDYNLLIDKMDNVKVIIGIGECREKVKNFGNKVGIDTYIYEYLKDGFNKAVSLSKDGDVVLLSPGTASWDQYDSFEKRGEEFKFLVEEI